MHCFEFFSPFPGASLGEKWDLELLMNMILLEEELGNKDLCGVNLRSIHSQAMLILFQLSGNVIYSFSEAENLYLFQAEYKCSPAGG